MVPDAGGPPLSFIPSPPVNGFHLGPAFIHIYGLMYVLGITLAVIITRRRLRASGTDPALVTDVATWAVPAGLIGGRIYFDLTTPSQIPPHWWGVLAIWSGGLGIWGGILGGALAGVWRVRRSGHSVAEFMDAVAPALLVAQAVGRIGNYFNQELFGKPSTLPWALVITPPHRPPGYLSSRTFQPTFLYELIFDLALAALLVWLGHHTRIRPPGLFALYVAGYSAFRIYEETIRIDYSQHLLGLRLNFFIACIGTAAGLIWFAVSQRRRPAPASSGPDAAGTDAAMPAGASTTAEAAAAPEPEAPGTEPPARGGQDDDAAQVPAAPPPPRGGQDAGQIA
jgi:prolipoprotein diacylglyceryl transferase